MSKYFSDAGFIKSPMDLVSLIPVGGISRPISDPLLLIASGDFCIQSRCEKISSLLIRECMHFFTLPEDPVMVRKIKPPRAQRITESCYFYLSPPLCHSVSSVVFRNLISKMSKSLRGLGHRNARIPKTQKILVISPHYPIARSPYSLRDPYYAIDLLRTF